MAQPFFGSGGGCEVYIVGIGVKSSIRKYRSIAAPMPPVAAKQPEQDAVFGQKIPQAFCVAVTNRRFIPYAAQGARQKPPENQNQRIIEPDNRRRAHLSICQPIQIVQIDKCAASARGKGAAKRGLARPRCADHDYSVIRLLHTRPRCPAYKKTRHSGRVFCRYGGIFTGRRSSRCRFS